MPERSRKKRPCDINALAAAIVAEATEEDREPEDPYEGKNPAAVELGRRGGLKGGRARAEKVWALTEIAALLDLNGGSK